MKNPVVVSLSFVAMLMTLAGVSAANSDGELATLEPAPQIVDVPSGDSSEPVITGRPCPPFC